MTGKHDAERIGYDEMLDDEDADLRQQTSRMEFDREDVSYLLEMIGTVQQLEQRVQEEFGDDRTIFKFGPSEREELEDLRSTIDARVERSIDAKNRRIRQGKSVERDSIGLTVSHFDAFTAARALCTIRELVEKDRVALYPTEGDTDEIELCEGYFDLEDHSDDAHERVQDLWERFLLLPRRAAGGKKAFAARYGVEPGSDRFEEAFGVPDIDVPDYRDQEFHPGGDGADD